MKKQSLSSFLKEDANLVLPIGKNKLISTSDNVFVLDKRGKTTSKELIDFNIDGLTKHPNKPHLVLITSEYSDSEYKKVIDEGYELFNLDSSYQDSFYMIDPVGLIDSKIKYIRELELQISNKRGKYLGIGEVFISHIDLRNKIEKSKKEVKNLINEFIRGFFIKIGEHENKKAEELLIGIMTSYCDNYIKGVERPFKLTYKVINQIFIDRLEDNKTKIKRYIFNDHEDWLIDKENLNDIFKMNKDEFIKLLKSTKNIVNKNVIKEKKLDLIELNNKKPYFITINDKYIQKNDFSMFIFKNTINSIINMLSNKKLCMFMTNINDIEKYEFIFKKVNSNIKIFISINSISENMNLYNDYINSFYKTKLFIGDTSIDSFKEMMFLCKLPFEEVITNDDRNVSKILKKVKNINYETGEMLLINKNEGFKIIKYKKGEN